MNPTSHELEKQQMFDSFSKKVLRNELRDYYDEMKRIRNNEVSFTELSEQELEQFSITDEYFTTTQTFSVLDSVYTNLLNQR